MYGRPRTGTRLRRLVAGPCGGRSHRGRRMPRRHRRRMGAAVCRRSRCRRPSPRGSSSPWRKPAARPGSPLGQIGRPVTIGTRPEPLSHPRSRGRSSRTRRSRWCRVLGRITGPEKAGAGGAIGPSGPVSPRTPGRPPCFETLDPMCSDLSATVMC